jgi:serine/threonine protein kinase
LKKGVVDLAIESDFLRVLQHPSIVRMTATAVTDPHENRYFVVLDRLGTTLDKKFNYWRKLVGASSGVWFPLCGYCCAKAPALHTIWKERIETALDIAKAIQYLHAQQIVYRDLKPDNLGFDAATGTRVKLFDFGLAKRLDHAEKPSGETDLYLLTGNTGSLRYMAPEIAREQPYNQSVDAYSFGILFWQICALQTPFAGFSERAHADKVVRLGQRPKPDRSWPASWMQLMATCWNQELKERPSFDVIVQELENRVRELNEEDGVIPSRASDIRAKKRKLKARRVDLQLDVKGGVSEAYQGTKRPDNDIV